MLARVRHERRVQAYFAVELGIGTLAFFLAYWIRSGPLASWFERAFDQQIGPVSQYLWILPVFLALWGAFAWSTDAYRSFRQRGPVAHALQVLAGEAMAVFAIFAVIALAKMGEEVNRSLVLLVGASHFALVFPLRVGTRSVLAYYTLKGYDRHFVVIAGTHPDAIRLARDLERTSGAVYQVRGFAAEDPAEVGRTAGAWRILGTISEIPDIARREVVDEVFFVPRAWDVPVVERVLRECDAMGVIVHWSMPWFEELSSRVRAGHFLDRSFVTFSSVPPGEAQLALKRVIDVVGAAALLVALSPALLLLGLLVALESPGGAIFRQQRAGMNGRRFTLYKFRTMERDAPLKRAGLESRNELDGPAFKIKDDPRVTTVGRFLRRTSLDELPQLWNVFKGDMSLVGPRPLPDYEVEKFQPWHRRRMNMRPGITCLWQISGRNEIRFDEWMRLDLEYIDRWSIWLDVVILLKTLPAVLRGRGAY
ncbi:MAG: sugar transferase [Planctomycetes bacterium]|nr:sugar transferase [Planctomycetota bacterium]